MSSDRTVFTVTLECSGDCGAAIALTDHSEVSNDTMAVAELLGWSTVDKGKEVEVFCPYCVARAKRVVATVGTAAPKGKRK